MSLLSTLRVPRRHHLDPQQGVGVGGLCPLGLGAGPQEGQATPTSSQVGFTDRRAGCTSWGSDDGGSGSVGGRGGGAGSDR